MKNFIFVVLFGGLALAQNQTTPACVEGTIQVPAVSAKPEPTAKAAQDALIQVFEGLKCGDVAYALRFMQGTPEGYKPLLRLRGYLFEDVRVQVQGSSATIRFDATVNLGPETVIRRGRAELVFTPDDGWKVTYESLAAMNLPTTFPR